MTALDHDYIGVTIFIAVLAITMIIGYQVMVSFEADMGKELNEYCEDEYGPQWSLDNNSETVQCVHPNGSTREPIVDLHGSGKVVTGRE